MRKLNIAMNRWNKLVGFVYLFWGCSGIFSCQSTLPSSTSEQLLVRLIRAIQASRGGYQAQRSRNRLRRCRLYAEALRELTLYLRRQRNTLYSRTIYVDYLKMPAFFAAAAGHRKVLALLIGVGGDIAAQNREGESLLHIASFRGYSAIVRDLLSGGAPVGVTNACGETPLHAAATRGYVDIVCMLIERGALLEARDMFEMTSLHRAAAHGCVEVAQRLIRAGAIIDVSNVTGMTPLHSASVSGQLQVVRYLVSKGAHIDARSSLGLTPLAFAAKRGHLEVVKFLVESDAECARPTLEGFMPLTYAAVWRQCHIVDYFISTDVLIDENQKAILHRFYQAFRNKVAARRRSLVERVDDATDTLLPEVIVRLIVSFVVCKQD